jgi:hypothetical protein
MLFVEDWIMRILVVLLSALSLLPGVTEAGPRFMVRTQNHRAHFVTRWACPLRTGFYYFNGANWCLAAVPYGGFGANFVYQGREVDSDVYPYAEPTANPDVVISPFAPNAWIDVTGVPPGARVRDPVSEQIFLRP